MRYRLIVWDFDGTLADTLEVSAEAFNLLASRHGFRPLDDLAAVRRLSTTAFLRHHRIPLWKIPMLAAEFRMAVQGRMGAVRLFAGVAEVLHEMRACLAANGAGDAFDFVVGYPRLFGKATAIRRLLRRESVGPREFLYVGDEVRDVEAARKAGVDVAAVGWGFHAAELLAGQTPTYFWAQPGEALTSLRGASPSP
jgi:phosphoglycolate phosphatase